MPFRALRKKLQEDARYNLERIEKAYAIAEKAHKGQKRKSGEDYIVHPIATAHIIYEAGGDEDMICAALIHDVVEDGEDEETLAEDIHKTLGNYVYFLVHALSKDQYITDKALQHKEYLQQFREALEIDISVFFLKIADLIHNMSTLQALSPEKQALWIQELKEDYIPHFQKFFPQVSLAHREIYQNLLEKLLQTMHSYDSEEVVS